jgi:hypothetical protein
MTRGSFLRTNSKEVTKMAKLHPDVLKTRPQAIRYILILVTSTDIKMVSTAWTLRTAIKKEDVQSFYLIDIDARTVKLLDDAERFLKEWMEHYLDAEWGYTQCEPV